MNIISHLHPRAQQRVLGALLVTLCLALLLLPSLSHAQRLHPSFNPNPSSGVFAAAAVGDHIWVGGGFTQIGGVARHRLARLNIDGSVDTSVPDLGLNGLVFVVHHDEANNHLYVGGSFTMVAGSARPLLVRLDATTGAIDTTFQPLQGVAGGGVGRVLVHGDKIWIGGTFFGDGSAHTLPSSLARLNRADGSLDTRFTPPALNPYVSSLLRQTDGRLVVGGSFTGVDVSRDPNSPDLRNYLIRLEADGTPDPSFDGSAVSAGVYQILPGSSNTLYVSSYFAEVHGRPGRKIAQLNADGSPVPPTTFALPDIEGWIISMVRQPDGKLLIGGSFTTVDGWPRSHLARLNANGTLDHSFADMALNDAVWDQEGLQLLPGNRLLIAGDFTSVQGQTRNYLAQLYLNPIAVTARVIGGGGQVSPRLQSVRPSTPFSIHVTPDPGYAVDYQSSASTCGAASVDPLMHTYRFHGTTKDCRVNFRFVPTADRWQVSATVQGNGGTVSPPVQWVDPSGPAVFYLAPRQGYIVDRSNVDGTCRAGSFNANGDTYTISTVRRHCHVVFRFRPLFWPYNGAS